MSQVDRLSNSGLYPMLPIADKHPSRDRDPPRDDKEPHDQPAAAADQSADPATPRPPKSLIDEYA